MDRESSYLDLALDEARQSSEEGGIPVSGEQLFSVVCSQEPALTSRVIDRSYSGFEGRKSPWPRSQ